MRRVLLLIIAIFALAPAATLGAPEKIDTGVLLGQMTDLDRLAELPDVNYRTIQFSSYDRRSKLPDGQHWFANSDGFGGEPIPGVEKILRAPEGESKTGLYLLADVEGPGAMVRGWTAGMNGEITLYLDGAEKVLFKGPSNDLLRRLYPAIALANGMGEPEGYDGSLTQRDAGYYPVAFEKRCRIEWEGRIDQLHFYHIEFRLYEGAVQVQSFQPDDLKTYAAQIARVQKRLSLSSDATLPLKGESLAITKTLAPSQPEEILHIQNTSGKITEMQFKLTAPDIQLALRQTVLQLFFDHNARPQIEAPLGDFFGAAPGINPYDSIPMTVEPDGTMTCRFVMPFAERAHIWAINHTNDPVDLQGAVRVADYEWVAGKSMHFRARWRVNHEMLVQGGGRAFDLPYLLANGQGRLVGVAALLMNPSNIPHPSGSWWGEGDEKIFVDDDAFPSFFGTGSEDYFNYSWSTPDLFAHAYFAQPRCDGPGNRGFVTNNRWHVLDDILFNSRLAFYMEMFPHTTVDHFSYARIAYYYALPGAYDDYTPFFKEELREPKMPETPGGWLPDAQRGAQGALFTQFEVMKGAEGLVRESPLWSAGKLILWSPSKEGEELTLQFAVAKQGKYQLMLTMALSPASGAFAVSIDGKPMTTRDGKEWRGDLFTPFHTMLRRFQAGSPVELSEGEHKLTLVSRGKNVESKGLDIGGDFIWLLPR